MLIYLLLVLVIVMPVAYCYRRSYFQGEIEINHVLLFTLGFLAYWISPIVLGTVFGPLIEDVVGSTWVAIFLRSTQQMPEYLLSCNFIYAAFMLGDILGGLFKPIRLSKMKQVDSRLLFAISAIGFLIGGGTIYRARSALFAGKYGTVDLLVSGEVAAVAIFLFINALIYMVQAHTSTLKGCLLNKYMLLYWPIGLILFQSGSRLYFISLMSMLFIYWTMYVQKIKARKLLLIFCTSLLAMGFVGVMRLGGGQGIIQDIASEPLFTAFSLISFLHSHQIHAINYPVYLFSDLINLVPSIFIRDKLSLMREIPGIYSPLGALNSFVSFDVNFGVVGTGIIMLLGSYSMRRMGMSESLGNRVSYIAISGWITFTLFRDPFSVSIVKNIMEFSIFLPVITIFILRVFASATSRSASPLESNKSQSDASIG